MKKKVSYVTEIVRVVSLSTILSLTFLFTFYLNGVSEPQKKEKKVWQI